MIAQELEVAFDQTSGPILQKKLDLTGILSNVRATLINRLQTGPLFFYSPVQGGTPFWIERQRGPSRRTDTTGTSCRGSTYPVCLRDCASSAACVTEMVPLLAVAA